MTADQRDELFAHAREEAPHECCGIAYGRAGALLAVERAENLRHSPYGFELGFAALQRANELDDDGYEVSVYHSHPRSEARPSQTDINLATYDHWVYLIVSLENADEPEVRAWRIEDGSVREEEIVVG